MPQGVSAALKGLGEDNEWAAASRKPQMTRQEDCGLAGKEPEEEIWRLDSETSAIGRQRSAIDKNVLEQLFESLHEDFATLKQEIAADVKDLKREVVDLGQHVGTLERTHDARGGTGLSQERTSYLTGQEIRIAVSTRGHREQTTLL
ncbi:hypothetical protein NDU88_008415 [Pleurodeles waltl]|uniref:Uncharacterized protein n=1 Tax=Pleurodeles waltl TaxID=8319 RepID=A0AAV7RT47_PLEWA|nr:hypothetical protein NDU88_008415 [Pleurodeles waltl]